MDTMDQKTFPLIPIRYVRGRSDQSEVSRKLEVSHSLDHNRERPEWSQS
jgi:hypothetical protein